MRRQNSTVAQRKGNIPATKTQTSELENQSVVAAECREDEYDDRRLGVVVVLVSSKLEYCRLGNDKFVLDIGNNCRVVILENASAPPYSDSIRDMTNDDMATKLCRLPIVEDGIFCRLVLPADILICILPPDSSCLEVSTSPNLNCKWICVPIY